MSARKLVSVFSVVAIKSAFQSRLNVAICLSVPLLFVSAGVGYADGWLPGPNSNASSGESVGTDITAAPNAIKNNEISGGLRTGGIANTRHNLTMSYTTGAIMDQFRNNYYEICVYCHTPHGANSTAAAPLWNRTVSQRSFSLYDQDAGNQTRDNQDSTFTQPGPNSLTCLSCHDGVTAIDSVINMPTQLTGEFRAGYSKDAETLVRSDFLDAWSGNKLAQEGKAAGSPADTGGGHSGFDSNTGGGLACLGCHTANSGVPNPNNPPDFSILNIAGDPQELGNDHPIGVPYPREFGAGVDYREPDVKDAKIAFFDDNSNGHADPNEIRLYDTGDGYEVECGSCHDPHGIKVTGSDDIIPSFLRVGSFVTTGYVNRDDTGEDPNGLQIHLSANAGSSLCLTCHVK